MAEFNQTSFKGGMNLLYDDTRIAENEYREAFNVRNRFDVLDQVRAALEIPTPTGIKQGLFTFGDYLLLFCNGVAYYQLRDVTMAWQVVPNFQMSALATKVYIAVIPVNTTNYARYAIKDTLGNLDSSARIRTTNSGITTSAASGNFSGVLVQNGVDQPWFIYVDNAGIHAYKTKKYTDWRFDAGANIDEREYVPVGTVMEWHDGILFIVSPDGETIYRSVSGRPLDFVVNIDSDGVKGGDVTTSSFTVGVGGITCLRAMNDGGLFVAAAGVSCFKVTLDRSNNARTLWGEPTFIRQFLFNAGCMNERSISDIPSDTVFVDFDGLRSFNAVKTLQNEGRNNIFSLKLSALFKGVVQDAATTATIVFDNYCMFAVNTIYGYVTIVYDTLNECFSSIDTQTNGVAIKQFAKIDTAVQRLYCITADDKVLQLFAGYDGALQPVYTTAIVRFQSICSGILYANSTVKMQCPKSEIRLKTFRAVLSGFRADCTVTATFFADNRLAVPASTKTIKLLPPPVVYTEIPFADVNSGIANILWSVTNCQQGWKTFTVLTWTGGGTITNIYAELDDIAPKNPLKTQANFLTV